MFKRKGKHSRAQEALKSRGAMQPRKAGALSATDLSHGFPGIPSWMNPVEAVQVYREKLANDREMPGAWREKYPHWEKGNARAPPLLGDLLPGYSSLQSRVSEMTTGRGTELR